MKCVYLTGITSRSSPVDISPIHSRLYHGWYHGRKIGGPRSRYVATNVDGRAFYPWAALVVAPSVLEAFRRVRPLDAQPTDILAAFAHHINLGDEFEDRFTHLSTSVAVEEALYEYLKGYATEVEKPTLFDVYPVRGRAGTTPGSIVHTVADDGVPRKESRYHSVAEVVFGDFSTSTAPIGRQELDFEPQRLEEYGVVFNWGHIFLPEMFEAIAPYVDNPFFYIEEFEI